MQFNSYIFILFFLPCSVVGYFLLNKIGTTAGKVLLCAVSMFFYGYENWGFLFLLLIDIIINYGICCFIYSTKKGRKTAMILGILINIVLLFYFKYLNFFVININQLFHTSILTREVMMPLGISFFTFQQIAFVVNTYKKELPEHLYSIKTGFIDYSLYVLFFPKILMGPITEPGFLIPQFSDIERKKVNPDNLVRGLKLFNYGLFKKLILCDTFAKAVVWGTSNLDTATSMDLIIVMISLAFKNYFDWVGYCDMATGASLMLNIDLPINFDSPYKSLSIREFWTRWHISLGKFFTKYIYIPLGGSRKGSFRTYLNIFIIFLITGFWHGATWPLLLWGAFHGFFTCLDRALDKKAANIHPAARWLYMTLVTCLLRFLFIVESIPQWGEILGKIFCFQSTWLSWGLVKTFAVPESALIFDILHLSEINALVRGLPMLIFIVAAFIICIVPENNIKRKFSNSVFSIIPAILLFVWAMLCLGAESTFVYFNF